MIFYLSIQFYIITDATTIPLIAIAITLIIIFLPQVKNIPYCLKHGEIK